MIVWARTNSLRVDDIEHGPGQQFLMLLWFKGTMDTVGLQFLLKNKNPAIRSAVRGNPAVPSSRPNAFGEVLQAFVTPSSDIQAAVEWALKGGSDPDFAVHLRLRHNRSLEAPMTAPACLAAHIAHEIQHMPGENSN